jgi:uncharacterized protein YndB with AHSA1/START domain
MAPITGSIEIARPPQTVFDYVNDLTRHTEWQSGLLEVTVESEGPTGAGTTAKETRKVPFGKQTYHYVITDYDPPKVAGFRVTTGPVRPEGKMTFTPLDDGARTRVDFEMTFKGHGFGVLLAPLATRDARKHVPGDLESLKERLESS